MPDAGHVCPASYYHHTRDADGEVILFFRDASRAEGRLLRSSPIRSVRELPEPVAHDLTGAHDLRKYLVLTHSGSAYEVVMPWRVGEHLTRELTLSPTGGVPHPG